jgi:hypothetical protein
MYMTEAQPGNIKKQPFNTFQVSKIDVITHATPVMSATQIDADSYG